MILSSALDGFLGGILIGLAAVVLMLVAGRIMGMSGIVGGILEPVRGDVVWRVVFVVGVALGGLMMRVGLGVGVGMVQVQGSILMLAGLLVGVGTVWGSGCTSGHGVCGLARFSKRSAVAVGVFMAVAMLVATLCAGGF